MSWIDELDLMRDEMQKTLTKMEKHEHTELGSRAFTIFTTTL
jgi:hypothetical protein